MSEPSERWTCGACGMDNPAERKRCAGCKRAPSVQETAPSCPDCGSRFKTAELLEAHASECQRRAAARRALIGR